LKPRFIYPQRVDSDINPISLPPPRPRSTDNPGTDSSRAILLYKQPNLREIAASLSMPIHSMACRFLSGAQMNEVIAKRLALNMALMCVRNTCIEDVHAGVEP
jgi:hypothetical protein